MPRVAALLLLLPSLAPPSAAPPSAAPSRYRYTIEAAGSELRWELPATLHTVEGTAPRVSGTIDVERLGGYRDPRAGEAWRGRVRVATEVSAMESGNASRDRKMRGTTLDAAHHPEIVFESRHVEADLSRFRPGAHLTVEVSGDLTVRGRSARVRLPVDVFVFPDHVMLSGSFSLGWKQFGLPDPSFGIVTVREPVRVAFRLRAVPRRKP